MYYRKFIPESELDYERKYGNKTDAEMNEIVGSMLSKKFAEAKDRADQRQAEFSAKYNLPYGELVRAISRTKKQIEELENKPSMLLSTKRKSLEAEYADLIGRGMQDTNRELWIDEKLVEYMKHTDGEYITAKRELQQARQDYAIYLSKKDDWEQENADIIMSERARTKREELLQADPEALRALGIDPVIAESKPSRNKEETADQKALRAMAVDLNALLPRFMESRGYNTKSEE
jgi:hypothetical protein